MTAKRVKQISLILIDVYHLSDCSEIFVRQRFGCFFVRVNVKNRQIKKFVTLYLLHQTFLKLT